MRRRLVAPMLLLALSLAACGKNGADTDGGIDASSGGLDASVVDGGGGEDAGPIDASVPVDGGSEVDSGSRDAGMLDGGPSDAGSPEPDAGPPDAGPPDAGGPLTFDVRVLADGFCDMLSFDPPSISVPAGTEFTVRWINATGCTEIDIDKSGTVPIVLGLPVGDSYHDTIRRWCGIFTGTFSFRAYYAPSYPFSLPVDCDG